MKLHYPLTASLSDPLSLSTKEFNASFEITADLYVLGPNAEAKVYFKHYYILLVKHKQIDNIRNPFLVSVLNSV